MDYKGLHEWMRFGNEGLGLYLLILGVWVVVEFGIACLTEHFAEYLRGVLHLNVGILLCLRNAAFCLFQSQTRKGEQGVYLNRQNWESAIHPGDVLLVLVDISKGNGSIVCHINLLGTEVESHLFRRSWSLE